MFILDSLMISGLTWVLDTVATAADAELDDDTALRERLLEAEMRREMGEMSDEAFASLEADVLQRIREIKERREGGSGPIAFGGAPLESSPDTRFQVEATISGDFHDTAEAATVSAPPEVAPEPVRPGRARTAAAPARGPRKPRSRTRS